MALLLSSAEWSLTWSVVAGEAGWEGLVPPVLAQLRVKLPALVLQRVHTPLVVDEQQRPSHTKKTHMFTVHSKESLQCAGYIEER